MRTISIKRTVLCLATILCVWIFPQNVWTHDQDGDEFPDEIDACPDSLVEPTVIIAEQDSGIRNVALGDGCTLADRVVECSFECPLESGSNQNRFVSCTRRLARNLVRDGVLTTEEREALVSFVAAQERLCHRTRNRTVELPREGIKGQGCTKEEALDAAREGAGMRLCVGDNSPECQGRCANDRRDECVVRTKAPAFRSCVFEQVEIERCPGRMGFVCTMGQREAREARAKVDCLCECRPR
jgi:hypothetical protein